MKRPARIPSQLSELLHQRLSAYALAASAAGVGTLVLAQPAEGRIVYTRAHHVMVGNGNSTYKLDLNHDGMPDFELFLGSHGFHEPLLEVYGVSTNRNGGRIVGRRAGSVASALPPGREVDKANLQNAFMAWQYSYPGIAGRCYGLWIDAKNRYLGLKFVIKGKYHFGWARLNVDCTSGVGGRITATLTGYAYETIPNKPIIAGKTHGEHEATLGRLAQGASGVVSRQK